MVAADCAVCGRCGGVDQRVLILFTNVNLQETLHMGSITAGPSEWQRWHVHLAVVTCVSSVRECSLLAHRNVRLS